MNFSVLDKYLDECKAMGITGCAVMVCQENKILYSKGMGIANKETGAPYDQSSKTFIYSCTKPITVTAVMQCYERGLLDIDDPVHKFIPEYKNITVKKGDDIVPAENTLTIRHLLTMTGGYDYTLENDDIKAHRDKTDGEVTLYDFASLRVKSPLLFEPGSKYQYSICHDILAGIVEIVTGKNFDFYLKENIFNPLGMNNTYFSEYKKIHDEIADMYFYRTQTKLLEPRDKINNLIIGKKFFSGGAGLISCAEDYIKFTDALATGRASNGFKLLEKETIDLLRSPQLAYNGALGFSSPARKEYSYGLGVRTRVDAAKNGHIGEFGWDGAAGCYLLIDPEIKLSVFFSENIHNWPLMWQDIHLTLRDAVYEAIK